MANVVRPDTLSNFIKNVELINIHLVSLESLLVGEPEEGKTYKINMRNRFPFEKKGSDLIVACNYNVFFGDNESDDTGFFKFKCTFSLHYNVKNLSEYDNDILKFFASNNAKFNSWSYFRELLSNITMRMEIFTLIAPLLKPRPPEQPIHAKR